MLTKLSAYLLPLSLLISISAYGQRRAPAQAERALGVVSNVSVASWMPLAELAASKNENASDFGQSVSVSGNTAVVGSWGDSDYIGAAYVFVKPSGASGAPAKVPQTARLTASDGQFGDRFGYSVSISGDTVVVGAYLINGGQGKAYIFVKPPNGWIDMTETAQLTASDGQPNDVFGSSVGISGSTVVVGSYNHTVGSNAEQGAVYVFVQPAGGWTNMIQTAELTASDGTANSRLGFSVAIDSDTVVAGEYNSSVAGAYVFVKPAGGWANMTETAKLTDPKDTGVGYSVAISGNTIVAGSLSGGPREEGVAHVYVKQGSTWKTTSENATLRPSNGLNGDAFGFSVATTGNSVTAGAPGKQAGTGIVYAYEKPASGWTSMTQTQELTPSDGVSDGEFGESVAANGPALLVGAIGTNTAYVYAYSSNSGFTAFAAPGDNTIGTYAFGVNNQGQIVGQYENEGGSCSECGFEDASGQFTSIIYPAAVNTTAQGINDDGVVVGWYAGGGFPWLGFSEENGTYTTINYPGATNTIVTAINDLGNIVGYYFDGNGGPYQGFLYSGGVFTGISVPGAENTYVNGINNHGVIVGSDCDTPCNGNNGFVYSNGIFTKINYPGAANTQVFGTNNHGDLVGVWGAASGRTGCFAFWSGNQQFVGFSIGDPDTSSAHGINDSGEIVGEFERGNTDYGFYGHLPGH